MIENALKLSTELAQLRIESVGIFPKGYVSLLAGEPGVGKTWFMLSVAKGVIDGVNGIGIEKGAYNQGRVLLFAGETGVRLLAQRFFQLLPESKNIDNLAVISAHLMEEKRLDVMLSTAAGRKNIATSINEFKPDIVFFDTMISFTEGGKDESSQVDMMDVIRGMSMVAQKNNCAIVMVHHFRKRQSSSENRNRGLDEVIGTSAFSRLAALVVGIERKERVRMVRCLKSWWQEFRPFSYRIDSQNNGKVKLETSYDYDETGATSIVPAIERIEQAILRTYNPGVGFTLQDVILLTDDTRYKCDLALTSLLNKRKVLKMPYIQGEKLQYVIPKP